MDITNFIRNGVTYPIGDTKSRESIATAFDSTASYSAGDYAMYDGTLYKFTSTHTGAWDSTHAEATCVTDELGNGGGGGNAQVMYYYQQPVNTATNAEIFRITSGKINTDTVVLECTFADPSYITSDVTWTSYDGYIAFTGTCTTATTANVTMAYKTENSISDRLLTLLWENPNPTSSFAAQTISLDLSQYDVILFDIKADTNNSYGYQYSKSRNIGFINETIALHTLNYIVPNGLSGQNVYTRTRNATISTSGITFGAGYTKKVSDSDVATVDNTTCIPLKIYGISKNNYTEINSGLTWTKAGSVTGTSTVTVPETATEIMAIVKTGSYDSIFSNTCLKSEIPSKWFIGGYFYSNNDYATVNLNVSNSSRTFQLRNVLYSGTDMKVDSTLTIYYR